MRVGGERVCCHTRLLPPMIVEMTIDEGTSLEELADKLGWDVDKLIEANGG